MAAHDGPGSKSKTIVAAKAPAAMFPIVGMGASAGGLEAFEQFFRNVPADCGMAFVLVPHLDPSHASILTEILQRSTTMPVLEAQDQMRVAPNHVYVIPPNRDMAILRAALQLSVPEVPRGQRMPIDAFLRSLAEDQGDNAIGVVLSGTGTDGTLGLRAILGAGGFTLAQEPASAKYDGMPTSAIRAGYVTRSLPADQMPKALLGDLRHLAGQQGQATATVAPGGMNRILMQLRTSTGHDFSLYKKSTIGRRIERRMSQHNIEEIETYVRYLKEHPAEVQALFKELLINVTSFFRDAEAFETLKTDILPQLLAGKPEGYVLRVWVAGCASGEEAYSIAMLLREHMDETHQELKVQIYATDLDDDAIAMARAGTYPPNIAQDVTPERLHRFFTKDSGNDGGYRVKKDIREMVVFAVQNVIKDPPFTRLDLLSCRNLMIYLEPELQNRLIPIFHYALRPGGVLFLSPSESIGKHPELFASLSRKWKFYRAVHSAASIRQVLAGGLSWSADGGEKAPEEPMKPAKETHYAEFAKRMLLQFYAPASVVTDMQGNILYVHGETGKYLRPAPGKATLNAIEMSREGLQLELRAAIHLAASQGKPTLCREMPVKTNGDFQKVSFSLRPLSGQGTDEGLLLVSFQEAAHPLPAPARPRHGKRKSGPAKESARLQRIEELERDLAYTKESLQATIEEEQASNEELKSTNEELQSTNEELQSTNEELETSKEELQSVNEELVTVNAELQAKIEQLADMQNDMKNLLDNINVGTIFLDGRLLIRRFTREAERVYRLVASDVGRPLADIKSDLLGEDLLTEAQAVLDRLVPCEREVRTADGTYFQVRIQPYRTLDNVIDGIVLTFADISPRVAAEAATREALVMAESIVDTLREPFIILNGDLQVVSASRSYYRIFRATPETTVGCSIYDLGNRQWDIPSLRELLESVLPQNLDFEDYVVEHDIPALGQRKLLLNARRVAVVAGGAPRILLAMEIVEPDKNGPQAH